MVITPMQILLQEMKKTIATIDRKTIKSFYDNYFQPDNAALIVVGDIDSKAMKAKLEKLFANWRWHG